MDEAYRYRVLKTSWGIAINMMVEKSFPDIEPALSRQIIDNLWLDVKSSYKLTKEELSWLVIGLRMIAPYFAKSVLPNHKVVLITISFIEFGYCDFQMEGLADCIIRWSSENFGLDIPEAKITFDKPKNRYVFDFSPLTLTD